MALIIGGEFFLFVVHEAIAHQSTAEYFILLVYV